MSAPPPPCLEALVPIRDGAALVPQICATLVLQTRPLRRATFLDDGSSDGTAEAVTDAARRRAAGSCEIVLLRAAEPVGVAEARNRLLANAGEGPLAWFDADDLWPADGAARRVEAWAALAPSARAATVLYGDYMLHPSGRLLAGRLMRLPDRMDFGAMAALDDRPRTIQLQATVGSRSAYLKGGGFDPALARSEDVDFMFRHLSAGGALIRAEGPPWAAYFQSFRDRDPDAMDGAHDMLEARWGQTLRAAGADPALWRLDKRLRYTVLAQIAAGDRAGVERTLRAACARRDEGGLRRLLIRRLRLLRRPSAGSPLRPITTLAARRIQGDADRALRLTQAGSSTEGPGAVVIELHYDDARKIVLEWRDAGGAVVRRREEHGGRLPCGTAELVAAWSAGACEAVIKGVAGSRRPTRSARLTRSLEGVLTLA